MFKDSMMKRRINMKRNELKFLNFLGDSLVFFLSITVVFLFFETRNRYSSKGLVNIYGNTGPGNERWPVVKFTVALLILPYNIVYGPVSACSKILHGPVEISIGNSCWPRSIYLSWPRIFIMKKTGKVSI